jgi:hypothetical protein
MTLPQPYYAFRSIFPMMDPTLGYGELAELFGFGCLGGAAGLCVKGDLLAVPSVLKLDGRWKIDMGFVAPVIAGGLLALLVGGQVELAALPVQLLSTRGQAAAAVGCAVAVVGPAVINSVIHAIVGGVLSPLLKRLGVALPAETPPHKEP